IGTTRQDLNVSISGGNRIEIKGVQDLKLIAKVVRIEVERQLMLLNVKKELTGRGVKKKGLRSEFVDITDIFKNTKSKLVLGALKEGLRVNAVKLRGFQGLLKNKLGPELAQYARAIANVKGVIHSDELPAYGISEGEKEAIRKKLNLSKDDAFVFVFSDDRTTKKALKCVIERCKAAIDGVPKETRKSRGDGTTEFMRPLPGSARMYPETDEALIPINRNLLKKIRENLPKMPEEMQRSLEDMGLSRELANQMVRSKWINSFNSLTREFRNIKPVFIATTLLSTPKEIRRKYGIETNVLEIKHFRDILSYLNKGDISKEAVPELLIELAKNPNDSAGDIIDKKNLRLISTKDLEEIIDNIMEDIQDMDKMGNKVFGIMMGKAMAKLGARSNPDIVKRIIQKKLKTDNEL
ncbi:MAG TPA: Glu-tRNA(Gln) amidotransferase subunit GatE, partial [Candidatus Altiarchaeales archaeon]|nr:Glu-tRNA(Gln) amidotransferase subunit GatE [Candidatus Altiarchaeales archaeon]